MSTCWINYQRLELWLLGVLIRYQKIWPKIQESTHLNNSWNLQNKLMIAWLIKRYKSRDQECVVVSFIPVVPQAIQKVWCFHMITWFSTVRLFRPMWLEICLLMNSLAHLIKELFHIFHYHILLAWCLILVVIPFMVHNCILLNLMHSRVLW